MSTRRMGLFNIPQEEWMLFRKLVERDEDIPSYAKHTFVSLHALAEDNKSLTVSSTLATQLLSGKSEKTFRRHLKTLREFCLIGTSITKYGTYVEFYSPWLRYTRISQKREQYSVEPNSWIHPRIAQYMHIAGKFPSDLKKLNKEYHTIAAVEKAMESLAWDVIHRDLAENGYAYIPNKNKLGVYDLVMYKDKDKRLVHDTSFFKENHDKNVWVADVTTGKKKKITFERSVIESTWVDPDLKEAVETRESFDGQAYALGFRMGQKAYEAAFKKELQTFAEDLRAGRVDCDVNSKESIRQALQKRLDRLWEMLDPEFDPEDPNTRGSMKNEDTDSGSDDLNEDGHSFCSDDCSGHSRMTSVSNVLPLECDVLHQQGRTKTRVISEKCPTYVNNDNSNNTIMKLLSSLYIFHKEINSGSIRYASLRSCTPKGGNCKLQNTEAEEGTSQEPLYLHDKHITHNVLNKKEKLNTKETETEETNTETEEIVTTCMQDPYVGNGNVTKTERNFTETDSEASDLAFSESSASNTDKVVGDSKNVSAILNRIRGKVQDDQEKQESEKLLQRQKRADRKARKALRDALAGTDIKLSNLTSDEEQDKLIADVCSHGLATDPDKVLPAWTVKHPAVRAEAYEASKQKAAELDKDVSWMLNVAHARKNAAMTLTEPLESLSWRCTLSSTHMNPDRSLNALKRFKAKFNHPLELPQHLKKHYPDCYRDQK